MAEYIRINWQDNKTRVNAKNLNCDATKYSFNNFDDALIGIFSIYYSLWGRNVTVP